MTILLTVLLVIVCFVLIGAILIQPGEGGDFMSAFAGGSTQVAFGSRGAVTFWTKVVTGAAVLFLVLVLSLSILHSRSGAKSVLPDALPAETTETLADQPAGEGDAPAETPADEPAAEGDAPAETPADEPAADGDAPAETPVEDPAADGDAPAETPAEEPAA